MSRAVHLVWILRFCLAALAITVSVLVFGPFSGAEQAFGLTDKEAHILAFYALCACSLVAMPRLRRGDVVVFCLLFGAAIEIIQPFVGRDGDIMDWLADSVGVGLAIVPMMFETLRRHARGDKRENTPKRRRSDRSGVADVARARRVNEEAYIKVLAEPAPQFRNPR